MRAPLLAAVSTDITGGGVAVASRLLWQVFEQTWPSDARLLRLIEGRRIQPSFADKARYGLRLGKAQLSSSTDWILFSHLALAKVQRAIPRPWRKPYAVFLHGIEVWRPLTSGQRDVLAGAELRIANSAYTAQRTMAMHPQIGHVEACPLALPRAPRDGSAAADASTPALGPHAVLVVGRMLTSERYKGHDELIDAWPQVTARVPDAQLVIVGHGDDLPRLREKAASGTAAGAISFTGFVSAPVLDALYARSALFALPSRGEGFGLVYLEAMAHRLACVGSVHDAARDVIVDGSTGALVDQTDIGALADRIASLLADEERRRAMGEAGYRRLQEEFAFDRFADRLCGLLKVPR